MPLTQRYRPEDQAGRRDVARCAALYRCSACTSSVLRSCRQPPVRVHAVLRRGRNRRPGAAAGYGRAACHAAAHGCRPGRAAAQCRRADGRAQRPGTRSYDRSLFPHSTRWVWCYRRRWSGNAAPVRHREYGNPSGARPHPGPPRRRGARATRVRSRYRTAARLWVYAGPCRPSPPRGFRGTSWRRISRYLPVPASPIDRAAARWPLSTRVSRKVPRQAEVTGSALTFQIFSAYSQIARSDEKRPIRATLRIDMRVQRAGSM